jgi:thymidylate synthase (FAD)
MNVTIIAHPTLSEEFFSKITNEFKKIEPYMQYEDFDRKAIAFTAIRTCYSPIDPTEIIKAEGNKYFANVASDGLGDTETDRLFRHITSSGHTSTLEHINYTFAIEGVSRTLLAQLTRHRHFSYSVQSQRYVRLGSEDKSGGFDWIAPPTVESNEDALTYYNEIMNYLQGAYDKLRSLGVSPEDARFVLPNATTTNIVLTGNLRSILDFYKKRQPGKGAQSEIADLAVLMKDKIIEIDPWLEAYFEG